MTNDYEHRLRKLTIIRQDDVRTSSPFCFLAVVGGTGGTTTGRGTIGGAELPAGAGGGWTGRNDWFGGWFGGCWLGGWFVGWLGLGWVGRNDW